MSVKGPRTRIYAPLRRRYYELGLDWPRSQSSSAISDVTSPVKFVGKFRARFQGSPCNSDSANCPGYEAGVRLRLLCVRQDSIQYVNITFMTHNPLRRSEERQSLET